MLKVMKKEDHRRLTGKYNGKPQFGPIARVWHGTTDWQKAVPTALVGSGIDNEVERAQGRRPRGQ